MKAEEKSEESCRVVPMIRTYPGYQRVVLVPYHHTIITRVSPNIRLAR